MTVASRFVAILASVRRSAAASDCRCTTGWRELRMKKTQMASHGCIAGLAVDRFRLGCLLSRSGVRSEFDVEVQLTVHRFDDDSVAGLDTRSEHHPRELVLDQPLDRPVQRARAEFRVV